VLGIDIGGTKVALAVGNAEGVVRAERRRPTEPTGRARDDVARIADDARSLLAEAGLGADDVACVGVSVPGPMDPVTGVLHRPPNLPGWDEVPVRAWLEQELCRPARLENDANAAALAEARFGAGRGFAHVVYLTMSTGVGAGLVLGGRLHRGHAAAAGEVGHAPVEWEGEPCACGMRGCLEAYVGGAAWTRRLRAVAPEASRAVQRAGGRAAVRPEHVVEAAREGDAFALAELARYNDYLARGIVGLVLTLAPDVVVLGTIPTAAGDALCLDPVRAQVRRHVWPIFAEGLEIRPAALGARLATFAGLCAALEGLAG
jgi:glucokinase